MLQAVLLPGLFAIAIGMQGQVATTGTNGQGGDPQGKIVRFDESSTAILVLRARGEGVQIYACVKGDDWAWKLKGPEATLFDEKHKAIGKHFAGPTWRLDDGSEVQGKMVESKPQVGTIPWLILYGEVDRRRRARLSRVDAVRRTETQGGVAPTDGVRRRSSRGRGTGDRIRRPTVSSIRSDVKYRRGPGPSLQPVQRSALHPFTMEC
jgi:hypothetical protein